jgi:sortase A
VSGRRAAAGVAAALLLTAGAVLARSGYLEAKAYVAERLIAGAFDRHLVDGGTYRPWRWADVRPLARLEVDRLGVRRYVLTGATGSSLAFGLGHLDGSAPPGAPGGCIVAGHRDSWAAFLRDLEPGDEIRETTRAGVRLWTVVETAVVESIEADRVGPGAPDRLLLVTCWPFDGWGPSSLRYVVVCTPGDAATITAASRPTPCVAPSFSPPPRASRPPYTRVSPPRSRTGPRSPAIVRRPVWS